MKNQEFRTVGKSVPRIDGKEKVTGTALYTADLDIGKNIVYAALVESEYAHAKILSIDTAKAESYPGVLKVFTGADFPYKFGLYLEDRYIFAQDKVLFYGEQVAVVVARSQKVAIRAAKLVKVKYKPLKPLFDQMESFEQDGNKDKNANLLHPNVVDYFHVPWFFPKAKRNIGHWRKTRKGDVEEAFRNSDVIIEDEYEVPRYAHCPIETHEAAARFDANDRLTVWASSQSPYTQRHLFAKAFAPLGLKHKDIRVITPYIGGGFGGKAGVTMEIIPAAIALKMKGYTVKLIWGRDKEFYNTYNRLGVKNKIKMGFTKEGKITAIKNQLYWDVGAYVEYGANTVNVIGLSATGPYKIDNVWIDSICVYTNRPSCGAYRGFGYSEFIFGVESHMNKAAKKLGIDEVELRRKNAIKEGDILAYGANMNANGLIECIDKVSKGVEWGKQIQSDNPDKVISKSFSLLWKAPAMPPNASSSALLKFNEDGSINLLVSGMDMGQGFKTVMAQIVSEVLSVPVSKIRTESPDTDRNPYEWQTVASHVTWGCGNAVKRAAIDAKEQIFDLIERTHSIPRNVLYLEDEKVKNFQNPKFEISLASFVIDGILVQDNTFKGGPIMGRGMFLPEFSSTVCDKETSQGGHPNVHYTVGAAATVLQIDKRTGKMDVLKTVEAIDVGKAINPSLVEGQMVGGLLQGFATALYEDIRFDEKGKILNPNFTDYKIPTAKDIVGETKNIIVEHPQPDGPFGARGVGEHVMIPAAPMIANAVANGLNIRINKMPITAEKVALKYKAKNTKQINN